jgi:hypothetical protein
MSTTGELTHNPEKCSRCGMKIVPKQHPHIDLDYVSNMRLSDMGPQWTCACATWGPADGDTFNPFDLDSVP